MLSQSLELACHFFLFSAYNLLLAAEVEKSGDNYEKKGQYARFWNEFGKSIKLGIIEDVANRNRLSKLLRVET